MKEKKKEYNVVTLDSRILKMKVILLAHKTTETMNVI
jgi:hypothetical protein